MLLSFSLISAGSTIPSALGIVAMQEARCIRKKRQSQFFLNRNPSNSEKLGRTKTRRDVELRDMIVEKPKFKKNCVPYSTQLWNFEEMFRFRYKYNLWTPRKTPLCRKHRKKLFYQFGAGLRVGLLCQMHDKKISCVCCATLHHENAFLFSWPVFSITVESNTYMLNSKNSRSLDLSLLAP